MVIFERGRNSFWERSSELLYKPNKTKMSLLSRIDALPIRAKVLCGSFAYGYTEKGDEPCDPVEFRVGADVYRYTRPYWYLATCRSHGNGDLIFAMPLGSLE